MAKKSYDEGRLNLPFVGFCTFGKSPICEDWDNINADVAILGAPFDFGTQWRSGARMGPRSVREASTLFSFGHGGAYSYEEDTMYLDDVKIVDVGDADIIHTNTEKSHENIEDAIRKILKSGALPVTIGGDHSVTAPAVRAFSEYAPLHVIQIDAHLDFVDVRHGVKYGHGNCMRRASEQEFVTGMTQLGIRNVSSSNREDHKAAEAAGSTILSVRDVRRLGVDGVYELIPKGVNYYITIDIDGFDPSIAAGTGTPSHGGFQYYEVMEILQKVAFEGNVVGIDLCEVAPDYDHTGTTSILAAQVLMNLIGYVFHGRKLQNIAEA